MPLALDDPRWNEIKSSYGDTKDVVKWLGEAYREGVTSDRLGDIINEVQHQGDTSSAMYAVAPHLIELSRTAAPEMSLHLLTHAGLICAESQAPRSVSCPKFLANEFQAIAPDAADRLARLLPTIQDFDGFKYAVAALAGFVGHHAFGRLISGLDYFEGEFHHPNLDEPFPLDE
jgi:hypothetical protein